MSMKWWLLSLILFSQDIFAKEEQRKLTLPIYVFEITPLIYQSENKEPMGYWFQSFQKLSALSNIDFKYHFVSIPRMELLLSSNRPGCNLTLLKTKTRMDKNIRFIYDHPVKTIFKTYQRADDTRKWTFKELETNKEVKIITNTSVAIEALAEKKISAELLFNIDSIINMLMIKRIDLFVGSNLAVERMKDFRDKRIVPGLVVKKMTHGIGCSQHTSPEIISRLRKAAGKWRLDD